MTDTYSGGPANGDNVNLAGYAVTCTGSNEVCTAGSSGTTASSCTAGTAAVVNTTGSGGLTIGSSATFVYAGPVCLPYGTITIQQGAKIYHDSSWASTPLSYVFLGTDSSAHSALWAVGTLGGTRIVWEGDSYNSPNKYSLHCTSANSAGCGAGQIGGVVALESGEGTFYNLTLQNIPGTSNLAFKSMVGSTNNTSISGMLMTNSGSLGLQIFGSKNITVDKSKFTATSNSTACLNWSTMFGGGTLTVTNSVIECPIVTSAAYTGITFRNVICSTTWSAGVFYSAGSYNTRPCLNGNSDSGTYDQVLFYFDVWNTTTTENGNAKGNLGGVSHLTNSITWIPKNVLSGYHEHVTNQVWNSVTGGTWNQNNNVYGALGDTGSATNEGHQVGGTNGGSPTSTSTLTATGNVQVCGYAGRGSMTANVTFLSISTSPNFGSDSITVTNNTYCASASGLSSSYQGDGSAAAESGTIVANTLVLGANTFFRNDGLGAGAVPELFDTAANSAYVTNPPWHKIQYNAVVNMDSGEAMTAPCGTYANNCGWINASFQPSSSTEIMKANVSPSVYMLDPGRSFPLFSEYLNASGIYPYSNYTGAAQYKGAWATSTSYSVGDIVYVDSTVTGYSGVYGGRRTWWICKIAHTSGSTNQPISGHDASNPYLGPTQVWEDAWVSMWLKPAILAGTTYSDGALAPLYGSPSMYAVGLVNAWIRQGFINVNPTLWGGGTAAPGCSANGGVTFTECGAVPLAIVRHIPPPAAVN